MDVNSIVCIGTPSHECCRSRKCVCASPHKPRSPTRPSKFHRDGPRILPVTPKNVITKDQASSTRSILRSHSPNNRNGSPTRVRFSDKGRVLTNGHCTSCGTCSKHSADQFSFADDSIKGSRDVKFDSGTQTQQGMTQMMTPGKQIKRPIASYPQRQKPLHYNTKTSTPRYNPNTDGDYHNGGRIIRNMDIERQHKPMYKTIETQTGYEVKPDGNHIIHNLEHHKCIDSSFVNGNHQSVSTCTQTGDLSPDSMIVRSYESTPSPKPPSPREGYRPNRSNGCNGCHCFANGHSMQLDLSTQMNVSDDSLRSQSPECQCSPLSDYGTDTSTQTSEWSSFGTQTDDQRISNMLDRSTEDEKSTYRDAATSPRKPPSEEHLTCGRCTLYTDETDDDTIPLQHSVSIQADVDDQEPSTKTTGVQCPMPEVNIPNGNSIIKNFCFSKNPKTGPDGKGVRDPQWKDFVDSIQKPTYENQATQKDTSTETPVQQTRLNGMKNMGKPVELKPCEPLSMYSARTLLENDIITKYQYDQIIQVELMRLAQQKGHPDIIVTPPLSKPSHQQDRKEPLKHDKQTTNKSEPMPQIPFRSRSNSLDFSPIRTYSFQPETSPIRTYSFQPETIQQRLTSRRIKTKPPVPRFRSPKERESPQRNLFIRSLDLGPLDSTTTSAPRSTHYITTHSDSPTRGLAKGVSRSEVSNKLKYEHDLSRRAMSLSPPRSRDRGTHLSPALNHIRNTAVRKCYEGRGDLKQNTTDTNNAYRTSTTTSAPRRSRLDKFTDRSRDLADASRPSSARRTLSLGRSFSLPRQKLHLPTTYHYLEALNDSQNRRRLERSRSPSRIYQNYSDRRRRDRSSSSPRRPLASEAEYKV